VYFQLAIRLACRPASLYASEQRIFEATASEIEAREQPNLHTASKNRQAQNHCKQTSWTPPHIPANRNL
jgi:hypothetical protein